MQHFVQRFSRRMNKNIKSVLKQEMDALVNYSWPREMGNWRTYRSGGDHESGFAVAGSGWGAVKTCSRHRHPGAADSGRG